LPRNQVVWFIRISNKPRYNFQRAKLTATVSRYIKSLQNLDFVFNEFSEEAPEPVKPAEFGSWITEPPETDDVKPKSISIRRPIKVNYLEKEQNNRSLGLKGEELAISFERYLLNLAGKYALADQIEWVSKEQGDGLGFDILSKNINGTDKFIEVKTTKLSKDSPFFFSSNEYKFSSEHNINFHLYRIFNFSSQPKIYTLNGSFDSFCKIEPINFMGYF
jgi:hypothetical protein